MDALCRKMVIYCGNLWSKDEIRFRLSLQEHCSKSPTEPRLSWKRKYHNAYIFFLIGTQCLYIRDHYCRASTNWHGANTFRDH